MKLASIMLKVSPFGRLIIIAAICFALFLSMEVLFNEESNPFETFSPQDETYVKVKQFSLSENIATENSKEIKDNKITESRVGEELITSIIADSLILNQKVAGVFFPDEWKVIYPTKGDTVYSIAKREDMPLTAMMNVNNLDLRARFSDNDRIIIFIGHKIESNASLNEIASNRNIPVEILKAYNGDEDDRDVVILPKTRESPSLLRFHFLSPFSKRLFERPGLETVKILPSGYLVMKGRSVKSSADGLVVFRGFVDYYGQTIIMRHPLNYFTIYGNLSSSTLNRGQVFHQGGEIGKVEDLLYFQLRQSTTSMDPSRFLLDG